MARAGADRGTPRRKAVERRQLEQAARRTTAGFAKLTKRQQREIVEKLHDRAGSGAIKQVAG